MKITKTDIVWAVCSLCFLGVFSAVSTLRIGVVMPFLSTFGVNTATPGGAGAAARGSILYVLQKSAFPLCIHAAAGLAVFVLGIVLLKKSERMYSAAHILLCVWNVVPSIFVFSNGTIRSGVIESRDLLAVFCVVFALACSVYNIAWLLSKSPEAE